jgi:hypothetical protein
MNNTLNTNQEILHDAYKAWCMGNLLRSRRLRNKRFTYGDQWSDTFTTVTGATRSEYEVYLEGGTRPITNNLIRQMVKTIVGRYRSEFINNKHVENKNVESVHRHNQLDELDSRALEEFLISGTAVQRIDVATDLWQQEVVVNNVNINNFFVNQFNDPLGRDCDMVGQLHDLTMAQLLKRVAGGSRSKAGWVRRLYSNDCRGRTLDFTHAIGADSHQGASFWMPNDAGKCRAIEVWTRESREVTLCHDKATAQVWLLPPNSKVKTDANLITRWDIATVWHCRWFSPMGDLLAEWDSPWAHGSHPFVMKFYPLTDGEVHSFVEDIIDQQKSVNQIITLINNIMMASAKGVLVFPETALPDGFTWEDIRNVWRNCNGILPYNPNYGDNKPEQISVNNTNIGAYEMVKLQMQLLEEISGVTGALQGKTTVTGNSATLYQNETANAVIALSDIFGTFSNWRQNRDNKIAGL